MKLQEKLHGDVVVISLSGSLLGEPDAMNLRQAVYRLLADNKRKFVIDLAKLKFINSIGLGSLIASFTSIRTRGGNMCLARVRDKVEAVIMITKLTKVFRLFDTVVKAVNSFRQ